MTGYAVRSSDGGSLRKRRERLLAEGRDMWREAYGDHLSDEECDQLSRTLLAFYGIDVADAGPAATDRRKPQASVEKSLNPRELPDRLESA